MGIDARMAVWVPEAEAAEIRRNLRSMSVDLVDAFDACRFVLLPQYNRHALSMPWDDPSGDGLAMVAGMFDADYDQPAGRVPVDVNLMTRYYWPGYERGDAATIIGVAEWCERRFPAGSIILYGGDSSGAGCVVFDAVARARLWDHVAHYGHRPYTTAIGSFGISKDGIVVPECAFCGGLRMVRNGWGKDFAAAFCRGCGTELMTRDGGTTWLEKRDGGWADA